MATPKNNTSRRRFLGSTATGFGVAATTASGVSWSEDKLKREFSGKTAFVTGGARGIGYGCAESLAKRGANIVLFDVAGQIPGVPYPLATEDDLQSAQERILALGVGCIAIKGDVRDGEAQANAVNEAVATFGSLDFVIANAGITQVGLLDSFSDSEVSLVIDINLKGLIKTLQAVSPILREQNSGRIVTMSSATGRSGVSVFPVYSATKWGVIGLTKSMAMDLGPHNVTCNAICPTVVRTGLLDNDYILSFLSGGQGLTFEEFTAQGGGTTPLPIPFFEPEDIGEIAAFLCSDSSAMISGDVFDVAAGANASFPA